MCDSIPTKLPTYSREKIPAPCAPFWRYNHLVILYVSLKSKYPLHWVQLSINLHARAQRNWCIYMRSRPSKSTTRKTRPIFGTFLTLCPGANVAQSVQCAVVYRVWAKLFRHALQTRVIARKQKPHRRHNAITSRRNTCPNCAFLCSAVQHKYMRPKIQQVKTKSTTIESRGAKRLVQDAIRYHSPI